jgi:hypothetical protein
MFSDAYEIASCYTRPLFTFARVTDDPFSGDFEIVSSVGAMVIINEDGCFVTASHIMQQAEQLRQQHEAWVALQKKIQELEQDSISRSGKKKKLKREAQSKPHSWVSNLVLGFGFQEAEVSEVRVFPYSDLAIGRIENFNQFSVDNYPRIKEPSNNFDIGSSLCRLGYPFANLDVEFNEQQDQFFLNGLPPLFPIESIYTRNIIPEVPNDDTAPSFDVKFIETSRPGLNGQSGGPIFDTDGNVWGIQSQTRHYPLGFDQEIQHGGKTRSTENSFLHVGVGTHAETLIGALDETGVDYSLA